MGVEISVIHIIGICYLSYGAVGANLMYLTFAYNH